MAGNGNIVKSWPQEITEYDLAVLSPAQSMYELWQSLFCIATMASSTATLIYDRVDINHDFFNKNQKIRFF